MVTPLYDAHCHPTDTATTLSGIQDLEAAGLCIMATRVTDQEIVSQTADTFPDKVIPCFGFHPWFVHSIYDDTQHKTTPDKGEHFRKCLIPEPSDEFIAVMPDLVPLSRYLQIVHDNLVKHPIALVGEVGLDKSFRLPDPNQPRAAGSSRHVLSKYRTDPSHQSIVLEAQLRLAADLGRGCSVHGVQAHGYLFNEISKLWAGQENPSKSATKRERHQAALSTTSGTTQNVKEKTGERTFPPRICLHSYSGSVDMLRSWTSIKVPAEIYFSFSQVINGRYDRWSEVVAAVPDDRVLIESDYHDTRLIDASLAQALQVVCRAKNWDEEYGRKQLETNYMRFTNSVAI